MDAGDEGKLGEGWDKGLLPKTEEGCFEASAEPKTTPVEEEEVAVLAATRPMI